MRKLYLVNAGPCIKLFRFASLLLLLVLSFRSFAQPSSAKYVFAASNNGSLVDMTGATQLVGSDADVVTSPVTAMPFSFIFMGNVYTHFMASSDGAIKLGDATMNTSGIGTTNDLTPITVYPVIAPFWDDLATGTTNGRVHYTVTGTTPNRVLSVEWLNMQIRYSSSTDDGRFQALLYEGTGMIQFIYGEINIGAGQTTAITASIGFSAGNTANTFSSVTSLTSPVVSTTTDENSLVNSSTAGPITGLHSTSDGSRVMYTWTPPPVLPAPSNLTFSTATASSITINWTDNATGEVGYLVSRSTDNINFKAIATTATDATSYTSIGLVAGTTYYYRVQTLTEGTLSAPASGSQSTSAGAITGTKTVGAGGDYLNLTTAFADINTNGLSGNIILQLIAGYPASPETYPIQSSNQVVGSFSVTVYPTVSGLSITSSNASGTLQLNGAKNIFIDGRVNATGTTKDLVIENISTTGYAVQFINDAVGNTITYTIVRGMTAAATTGVISFSTTNGTLGNNNNTISNSDLRDATATPANIIHSTGSVAIPNSNNTITTNNIFNFFQAGAVDAAGIRLDAGNTGWTITNNSFYQTATRTSTAGATGRGIYINSSAGNGYAVSGNFVGGNASGSSGTWTNSGAFANRFIGIHMVVGNTIPTTIQNNTIKNFNFTSTSGASTEPGVWAGISLAGSINTSDNIIGEATGTGSIAVTSSTTGAISYGIVISGGTGSVLNVNNNSIGSITTLGSTTSIGHSFRAISNTTSGTISITNNTIGSATTANSINLSTATGGTIVQEFTGIRNSSSLPILTINNNLIANINNATTSTSGSSLTRGIVSSAGIATIRANTIRTITSSSAGTGTGASATVSGISYTATTTGNHVIGENIIHSLGNTAPASASHVVGIHYAGPTAGTNLIERNFVHSLSLASTSATATLVGINASSGFAYYQNNMIRLGINATGSSITNGNIIVGIDKAGTTNNNFYHNTVYIGGQDVATNAANSFAFRRTASPTVADSIYNNIFVNNRSNAGSTGKHYAIGLNTNTFAFVDYNLYHGTGAGFIFGYVGAPGATDYLTFGSWKTASSSFDENSQFANPMFVNPNGDASTVDLHLTTGSPAEGSGLNIASVTNDIDGEIRSALTPTDIGADAGNYGFSGTDVGIIAIVSPPSAGCYTNAEQVSVTLKNFSSNPIDFSTNNVTITVAASGAGIYNSNIVLNTGTLAAGATRNIVLPSTLNMTAQGTYSFTSTAAVTSGSADVNSSNNSFSTSITNSIIGGSYLVGVGETYTTLTAAIAAYNAASCMSGAVTFTLKDATYPSETFPIVISKNASASSTNTLTIKPASGVAVVISGTSGTTASALLQLNGAQHVIVNGLNTDGSSLMIENTSVTAGTAVVWMSSNGVGNGASNNTIKNLTIKAGVTQNTATTVTYGIVVAGNALATTTTSIAAGDDNDNNRIDSNNITKVRYAIFTRGGSTTNPNSGNQITNNIIGPTAFGTEEIGRAGILVREEDGLLISRNTVQFVGGDYANTTAGTDRVGIGFGTDAAWAATTAPPSVFVKNTKVIKNLIRDVVDERTFSAAAIVVGGVDGTNPTNNVIANNMIFNIRSNGTFSDQTVGIGQGAGISDTIAHNSIYLTGDVDPNTSATAASIPSSGMNINSTSVLNPVWLNNFVFMDLSSSSAPTLKYAAVTIPASFSWGTGRSNYNDLFVLTSNPQSNVGSTSTTTFYPTLADWQTATSKDANSLSVDPMFVSATDLHIQTTSPVKDQGIAVAGVTDDYDSESRDASPDMGADELIGTLPVSFTSIRAFQQNAGVQVEWKIAAELNLSRYEVERSVDGRTFTNAGVVSARGASAYNWFDASPVQGNNYYRIRAVNNGGSAQYTSIARVFIGKGGEAITVYPNPVQGDVVNVALSNLAKGVYTISISNQLGQRIHSQVVNHPGGSANQSVNMGNGFAKGFYQLQITGEGQNFVQRIVKQ